MEFHQKKIALLVFSLSPEMESTRKAIFDKRYRKENTAFFNVLIHQTKELASQSGIDVFWTDEREQIGRTFSMRLTNAFQKLFDAGYENVISIGNDCPDLTLELLQAAIKGLPASQGVIGPSRDGGVYLLGISKKVFDYDKFIALPWQTRALRGRLESYFNNRKIRLEVLDELMDLDTAKDVRSYATGRPLSVIVQFFRAILAFLRVSLPFDNTVFQSRHKDNSLGLRAPPVV